MQRFGPEEWTSTLLAQIFALSILREFGLDLGFDSRARQNSIFFNSHALFEQIKGELQGENSESSVRNDEEAWSG